MRCQQHPHLPALLGLAGLARDGLGRLGLQRRHGCWLVERQATWADDAAAGAPRIVDTIDLPGTQPLAVAVYEPANRVFVTDDNGENLLVIDGATRNVVSMVPVGGASFEMVVNETYGKVYVASDKDCCTTGVTPGYYYRIGTTLDDGQTYYVIVGLR